MENNKQDKQDKQDEQEQRPPAKEELTFLSVLDRIIWLMPCENIEVCLRVNKPENQISILWLRDALESMPRVSGGGGGD